MMRRNLRLLSIPLCLVGLSVHDSRGADVPSIYELIEQSRLTPAEKYEEKLAVYKAGLEAGERYLDSLEKLSRYSRIMAESGLACDDGFGRVTREFSERIGNALDHPVIKKYGYAVKAEGYVSDVLGVYSDLSRIDNDPNLNDAARTPLKALRTLSLAMEHGGWVPVVGNLLEPAGEFVTELTRTVQVSAEHINTLKGGTFSAAEQRQLAGLPTHTTYQRTPLYDLGVPVVVETVEERGDAPQRSYIRVEGRWVEIPYREAEALVAEYRYIKAENPEPEEIMEYLGSMERREDLQIRALTKADEDSRRALFDDISDDIGVGIFNRTSKYKEFLAARNRINDVLRGLGLVVSPQSKAFRMLLLDEIRSPGSNDAILRRLAIDANPLMTERFLRYKGINDIEQVPLEQLVAILKDLRDTDPRQLARLEDSAEPRARSKGGLVIGKDTKTKEPAPPADEDAARTRGDLHEEQEKVSAEDEAEARRREKKEREDKARRRAEWQVEKDQTDPPAEERYEDASIPVIPENCVIDVVTWWSDDPGEKFPGSFTIIGGQVTASYETTNPEQSGELFHIGAIRYTGEFVGELKDNAIRGTWTRIQHRHKYTYWNTRADGSSYQCVHERWGQTSDYNTVELHRDGTLTGLWEDIDGTFHQRVIECPESSEWTSMSPEKKTMKFRGTWHIR